MYASIHLSSIYASMFPTDVFIAGDTRTRYCATEIYCIVTIKSELGTVRSVTMRVS
jgi:proteasome assembly chaperone (PAC2) family protein